MLELLNIKKQYNDQPLLRDVSFSVYQNETVCLLGPSGGGKSTILRIIAGLEKPASGIVKWNGKNISQIQPHKREFGLMFQDYALFPHLNVSENIAFGLHMRNIPEREIFDRVQETLEMVSLSNFANRSVIDLSGGEKQRVAFARAIAPQPKLLMLDEPMGSLDRALRDQLLEELHDLLRATEIPVIYVTHDQEEAFSIADRILILHEGMIVQSGNPLEVYTQPRNLWVASFFGLNNHLIGKITSQDPFLVETEIGLLEIMRSFDEFSVGEKIDVVILPTALQTGGKKNVIMGKIKNCVFRGVNFHTKIQLQNSKEFAFEGAISFKVGETERISINPEKIICFAKGS